MITRRGRLAAAALAVLALACGRREEPRISAEAAAAFGHVRTDGQGGSLVLDVDALRALGFRPGRAHGAEGSFLVDLAVGLLPTMAAEVKDDAASAALARAAVLLRLVGDWATAPEVQRLGVVAEVDPSKPDAVADGALVLLAVRGGERESRDLLQGLGAAVRAVAGRELVRTEHGNLCTAREATPELPFQLCIQAGPGFYALGTARALSTLATPSATPAAREPGPVLHLLARARQLGRIEVTAEGRAALRVVGVLEPEDPAMAKQVEKGIRVALEQLDVQSERQRLVVARALEEVKGSLAKDPEAPEPLKGSAAAATVEKVIDPRGEYAALRKSIQVANTGKAVTVELTLPEGQVRRAAQVEQSLTMVWGAGVLAAIAIPNFLKYQCRAKASEGPVTLKAAWGAMERQRAARGRYPADPDSLDFQRPPRSRYTLCTRSGCSQRAIPAAALACKEALAGVAGGPKSPALCAAADLLEDGNVDVWVLAPPGQASHVRDVCR